MHFIQKVHGFVPCFFLKIPCLSASVLQAESKGNQYPLNINTALNSRSRVCHVNCHGGIRYRSDSFELRALSVALYEASEKPFARRDPGTG